MIALRCVGGGPREGHTIDVEPALLIGNLYLSAADASGFYWRAAGLTPLVMDWKRAPGDKFLAAPETVHPRPAVA